MRNSTDRVIYSHVGPEVVPASIPCMRRGCGTLHDPLRERGYTPYCEPHRKEERVIDRLEGGAQ